MQLRDYEREWLARVRRTRARRVLIVGPTGCGKTVIASHLIRDRVRAREPVLFVVHRRELAKQAVQRLRDVGIAARDIGVMIGNAQASGLVVRPDALVQVASVQTLAMREQWPAASLLIIDEAHHATAKTYRALFEHYDEVQTYGLTATPYRLDGAPLGALFDEIVQSAPPSALIAAGWIAKPLVYTVPATQRADLSGVSMFGNGARDYHRGELARAVNRPHLIGSILEHWQRHAQGRAAVCFAVNIAHGVYITREFRAHGVAAELVTGTTPLSERDAVLSRVRAGTTQVIVNCGVFTEGWDAPEIKLAIIARPTMSRVLWMQMAGRLTRPHEHTPVVLDHAGNAIMHGLPLEDEWPSLNAILVARRKRHGELPEKACPECGGCVTVTARVCSFCDYEFWEIGLPEEEAGRLVLAQRGAVFCTYAKCPRPGEPLLRAGRPRGRRTGKTRGMHAECTRVANLEARHCQSPTCPTPDVLLTEKARTKGTTMHKKCWGRVRAQSTPILLACNECGVNYERRGKQSPCNAICEPCHAAKRAAGKLQLSASMKACWTRPEYRAAMHTRPSGLGMRRRCERCGELNPLGHRFHGSCWKAMSKAERAEAVRKPNACDSA
jgi:superfamily II DNA or RNA helicase